MLELSIFVDESGDKSDHAKYYLLTLVFHNQADSIIDQVMTYERSLADADLPNIAFHSGTEAVGIIVPFRKMGHRALVSAAHFFDDRVCAD